MNKLLAVLAVIGLLLLAPGLTILLHLPVLGAFLLGIVCGYPAGVILWRAFP